MKLSLTDPLFSTKSHASTRPATEETANNSLSCPPCNEKKNGWVLEVVFCRMITDLARCFALAVLITLLPMVLWKHRPSSAPRSLERTSFSLATRRGIGFDRCRPKRVAGHGSVQPNLVGCGVQCGYLLPRRRLSWVLSVLVV